MDATRPRRLRKFIVSAIVILTACFVMVVVARMPVDLVEVPPREEVPVPVEVIEIEPRSEVVDILSLPGALEANQVYEVPVEQSGQIEEVFVSEGDFVTRGQVFLKLNSVLLEAEHRKAKAEAEFSERTFRRSVELLERGVLNRNEVEELESRQLVSAANLELARTNLDRATVYAPVSGVVNELVRQEGEWVASGDPVARIVDVETLKLVLQIPEMDLRYIQKGKRVDVSIDALSGRRVGGSVHYISRVADEATRTTRVEVALDNRNGTLYTGMIVRAMIPRRVLRDVIMIPLSAVIPAETHRLVYVARDGIAEQRIVELGLIRGSEVQVIEGLKAGDLLIVRGNRQVGPNQLVEIGGTS